MKYIKGFLKFNENIEIDSKDSDKIKDSKEKLNDFNKIISEYKSKKSPIESIYKDVEETDDNISKKVEEILGKDNINPYLTKIVNICNLQRKISKIDKSIIKDTEKIKLLQKKSLEIKDNLVKIEISKKIIEIKKELSEKNKSISEISKEIKDYQKELDEKINNDKKSINDYIENITK
jgi:DNA repair ATPase RecN